MRRLLSFASFLTGISLLAPSALADDVAVVVPSPLDEPISVASGQVVCRVTEHGGVDADDARTATDLLCGELAERGARSARYDVRFGPLDGSVLVTVTGAEPKASRRILLGSLGEMPVAAPRLAQALLSEKPVADTAGADNVVTSEARQAVRKNGSTGAYLGLVGATSASAGGTSGGFDLGIDYRLGALGIGVHGRAGGIGSNETKLAYASADIAGSLHPWDGNVAPFLGTGLVLGYYDAIGRDRDRSGSGLATFVALGVDAMRNARIGARAFVRADVPFFALEGRYVVPVSLNVGLAFR